MIGMVLSDKRTGLSPAPLMNGESSRKVRKVSRKSPSSSRQHQLREAAQKAAVSKKEIPEKKGSRKPTEAAAPSSLSSKREIEDAKRQLSEMRWHDFQSDEKMNEIADLKSAKDLSAISFFVCFIISFVAWQFIILQFISAFVWMFFKYKLGEL